MQDYQQILVASDLSPASDLLLAKALHIAKNDISKISVVNVINYPPAMYGSGEFAIPLEEELEAGLEQQAKQALTLQAAKFDIASHQQYVIEGCTNQEIVSLAKDIKADLIVVGGHDRRGLALLFGSTANAILHAMPCDILTIRVDEPD